MKMKITRYFAMLAAVAGLSSACQEELEHVVYNPENVVAPVLNAVEDIEITVDELSTGSVKFSWEAADFGVATQVYYSLDMSAEVEGQTKTVNLFKNVSGKEGSASFEKINGHLLYDFNFAAGEPGEVSFTLYAGLKVGATYASNVVKANATAAVAERTYPTVWVIGDYCGWAHDKTQFLYDYDGADDVYSGLVDFGEKAANGFKLTGIAGWDDTCNWGEETKATEADEPAKIQLITGGGSQDIKRYAKRFYGFSFSKKTLELTKNYGFDKVGVIGLNGDWENDIVMEFNAAAQKQVFYVDVEVAAATEFKFRMDGGWDVNFGGDMKALTAGGANIAIEPGNYRIYLNLNNPAAITCSLDTRMYGKEEGGAAEPPVEEPEPEKPAYKGWGIVGSAVGSWDVDVPMTSDGTWHVAKQVVLAEGEAKFRLDAAWDTNLGGATFEANKELTLTAGGNNIVVVPGTYDIYLNPTDAKVWFINDGSYPGGGAAPVASEWGLIGSMAASNNWGNNIKLFVDGDYSVAKGVVFADGDQFKFRKGETWGTELTYEGAISIDAKLALIDGAGGKQNSSITTGGTYDVYLANDLSAYYVMTPGKTPADAGEAQKTYVDPSAATFVVGFSGSALDWDDPSFDANDRASFVSKNVTDAATFAGTYEFKLEGLAIAQNDEFKVRINGQWIGVGGATLEGLATSGTDNFIAGEAGTYTAVITFAWDGSTHSDVKVVFSK